MLELSGKVTSYVLLAHGAVQLRPWAQLNGPMGPKYESCLFAD